MQTAKPAARNLVVDGMDHADTENAVYMGDGEFPPFVVFDVDLQENILYGFATRAAAEAARRLLLAHGPETYTPDSIIPEPPILSAAIPATVWLAQSDVHNYGTTTSVHRTRAGAIAAVVAVNPDAAEALAKDGAWNDNDNDPRISIWIESAPLQA